MPRNGSGTFSITNSFTSGTTIQSSAVNANFSDVGAEITNSVAKDGQTTMTGQLKAASGTAAAPGYTFGSDLNTGFFLKSGDTIGIAAGGVEIASIGSSGVSFLPSGTVMLFVQTSAPTGWTKSTTHNNKALRVVSGTASSGGTTAFTSVFTSRTLVVANLPAHTHGAGSYTAASGGAHTHTISSMGTTSDVTTDGGGFRFANTAGTKTTDSDGAHTHTISGTSGSTGSGTAIDFAVAYVDVIIATRD